MKQNLTISCLFLCSLCYGIRIQKLERQELFKENLRLGKLSLRLRYLAGLQFTDNYNRAQNNKEEQLITRQGIITAFLYPVSNDINVYGEFTTGYDFVLDGDKSDEGFFVRGLDKATAFLSMNVIFDDNTWLLFTESLERDDTSFSIVVQDQSAAIMWENNFKALFNKTFHRGLFTQVWGERTDRWAEKSEFQRNEYVQHEFGSFILQRINRPFNIGPFAIWRTRNYVQEDRSDFESEIFGIFCNYVLGLQSFIELQVGYQTTRFERTNPFINDVAKLENTYIDLLMQFQLTPKFKQEFQYQEYSTGGVTTTANGQQRRQLYSESSWRINKQLRSGLSFKRVYFDETSAIGEDGIVDVIGLFSIYDFSEQARLLAKYQYIEKDSSINSKDYDQNIVNLEFTYLF